MILTFAEGVNRIVNMQQGIPAGRAGSKGKRDWRQSVWLVWHESRRNM